MTKQIVLKLNKKKFEPLINHSHNVFMNTSETNSELVGKLLFFMYLFTEQKNHKGRTRFDICLEHYHNNIGTTALFGEFFRDYRHYLQGKLKLNDMIKYRW